MPPRDARLKTSLARFAQWSRTPLLRLFRVTPEGRTTLVQEMFARQAREAGLYWLQLSLAAAIATLGLALGSSAVVIGAMLISPLMSPIVELGMGLAVGSPLLVVRAAWRVAVSVVIAVGGAALITLALPYHEITAPIAARAAPTALDLLIAICCALMAAFATAASMSASAATTAAGTAIAIALVPPLCVVGFGIGTHDLTTTRGAGLLFIANFCAILLFAVVTFIAFGFGAIDVARLELDAESARGADPSRLRSGRAVARLRTLLGSASGGALRVGMPLLLLALVYVPLRRALIAVAWEVRVRQTARSEIELLAKDAVTSSIDVGEHRVRVQLVVIGTSAHAHDLERELARAIAPAAGFAPTVEVLAVADAAAVQRALDDSREPSPLRAIVPAKRDVPAAVSSALASRWPAASVGALDAWRLDVTPVATCADVVHVGAPLDAAALQLLAADLTDAAGEQICVHDVALPAREIEGDTAHAALWLARVGPLLDAVARYDALYACILAPIDRVDAAARDAAATDARATVDARGLDDALATAFARLPADRALVRRDGRRLAIRVQATPCLDVEVVDGGAGSDAAAVDAAAATNEPVDAGPTRDR
jgi:uncharacterized hydrophobic protein (TIGR00271 family)